MFSPESVQKHDVERFRRRRCFGVVRGLCGLVEIVWFGSDLFGGEKRLPLDGMARGEVE